MSSGKALHTIDNSHITLNLNISTHTGKLVHILKAILKDTLGNHAGSLCKRQSNRHLRLHIRWKTGIRQSLNISRILPGSSNHTYLVIPLNHLTTNLNQLR